ncbi:hypothetical protein ACFSO7_02940 [Bacillus sp. CGMCC 1.16607]|uniref:hypothetical protein n=1 Tax=Bacillus sp. CGMCC 1.16607 TaxID=3351842 RepID=UPI00362547FD
MEKTILIDEKKITFKSTGATALRYKAQFGKDYLTEILKLDKLKKFNMEDGNIDGADFEVFYNIAWVMAKTADQSISDPLTWLDGFDEFPLLDIIPELQELMTSSLKGKKK